MGGISVSISRVVEPGGSGVASQRSWRIAFGLVWLCTTSTFMVFAAAIPFMTLYLQELGQDRTGAAAWAGAINAVSLAIIGAMNMVWGVVADRWGTKLGLIRSQVFSVIGMAICGLAASAEFVFLGRLVQAIGGGPQSAALALTGAIVPAAHMGLALGLMQTGQAVGAAVGPVIGGIVGDQVGYRNSFLAAAVIIAIISALAMAFVKEPPRPAAGVTDERLFSGLLGTLKDPLLRDLALLVLLFESGYQAVWTFVPLRIQEISPDQALVGTYSGAALMGDALGVALGSLASGGLMARLGARRILLTVCLAAAVSTALQVFTTAIPLFVLLRFIVGLALGSVLTVARTRLVQNAPPERRGTVLGVSQGAYAAGFSVGALAGSTAIAALGLRGAFLAALALFIASLPWAVQATRQSSSRVTVPSG